MNSRVERFTAALNRYRDPETCDSETLTDLLMVNLLFIEDDEALSKPGVFRSLQDPTAGTTHPHRQVRPHHQTLRPHLGHHFPGRNRTDDDLTELTAPSRSCVPTMKSDNALIYVKTCLRCQFNNFMLWNHAVCSVPKESIEGINSRQRVINLSPFIAGSSCALPLLSRDLQAVTSEWFSPSSRSARKPNRLNAAALPRRSAYSTSC